MMYRNTYALIHGKTIENNVLEIKNKYKSYKYYFGVVKNNAYAHGMKIVKELKAGGINYFAVSSLEEALDLRSYDEETPILILEPVSLEYIDDATNANVTLTVESLEYAHKLSETSLLASLKVHLKIDSGMHRLGFMDKDMVKKAYDLLKENEKIIIEGVYSHFATSGIMDVYYDRQIEAFQEITSFLPLKEIPIVHMGRSESLVLHKKIPFCNGIRLGIILYGFNNCRSDGKGIRAFLRRKKREHFQKRQGISETYLENDLNLHTAMSLYSEILSIRKLTKGDWVGYGANYICKEDCFIATIPIGYADGVTKEFGEVSIGSKRYPIVADSMDMLMVKVDDTVSIHDKVEIFGDTISIRSVCRKLGCNSYHLFQRISNRVVRVHENGNERVEIRY